MRLRVLLLALLLVPVVCVFVPTASAVCYWNRDIVDDVTVPPFTVAFYDGPVCTVGVECEGRPFPQHRCTPS